MSLISNLQFTGSARTKIPLTNYTTTAIMDASAYEAGEIAGWFSITATVSYRFWFSAKFAKNGAGTDYWISPSTMGDAPPAGFGLSITTAGIIQVFLPNIPGFISASVTYALDAPAVGAEYPLWVDGTQTSAASAALQGTVSTTAQTFGGVKTFQDPPVIGNASGIVAASETVPGVVTTGAQSIAGAKTLTSALTLTPASNQLVLGTTRTVTLTAPTPAASSLTHTIPDVGANANFVMDQGAQTVGGAKTLSSALTVTPVSNQLVLGTTRTVTITAPTPATASRTHTIPDVGANANFVMDQGDQTVAGAKTFSSLATFSSGAKIVGQSGATAPASGDVAESATAVTYSVASTTHNAVATTSQVNFTGTLTLAAGRWLLIAYGTSQAGATTALAASAYFYAGVQIYNTTSSSVVGTSCDRVNAVSKDSAGNFSSVAANAGFSIIQSVNISASTNFVLRSNSTASFNFSTNNMIHYIISGRLYAIRIS